MSNSSSKLLGRNKIVLDFISSTNNYIADHPDLHDLADGTAVLAYRQSAGRGQRGRGWLSTPGKDLTVSFLLRPQSLSLHHAFLFNKAIALGVRKTVARFVTNTVKIKWPNDILIQSRKVSGILIEMSWLKDRCQYAIVGVGLNVLSTGIGLGNRTCSLMEYGYAEKELDPVFEALCEDIESYYNRLNEGSSETIEAEYQAHLFGRNEMLTFAVSEGEREMKITGVDELGRLCLMTDEGPRSYNNGEIGLLI